MEGPHELNEKAKEEGIEDTNKQCATKERKLVVGIDVGTRELGLFAAYYTCLNDVDILSWDVLDLGRHTKLEDRIAPLINLVTSYGWLTQADDIVIEKQIGPNAVLMTALSYCIQTAIATLCVDLKKKPKFYYFTSQSKFAHFKKELGLQFPNKVVAGDDRYLRRKKIKNNSIWMTKELLKLSNMPNTQRKLAAFPRRLVNHQDDMADACGLALVLVSKQSGTSQ